MTGRISRGGVRRAALAGLVVGLLATVAAAQGPSAGPQDGPTSEEVYRLLDRFVMTRARAVLQLSGEQLPAFSQRMMRLQTIQRQHRRQRQRILNELRRIVGPRGGGGSDEAALAARIRELDDLDARMGQDERRAVAAIDEVLGVRQRAQFRVFLENIERQKLDLLMRARQGRGRAP